MSEKEMLIGFLDWMDSMMQSSPMIFETDNEDVAMMYLDYVNNDFERQSSQEDLRHRFFQECTTQQEGATNVNMTAHNIFDWFMCNFNKKL